MLVIRRLERSEESGRLTEIPLEDHRRGTSPVCILHIEGQLFFGAAGELSQALDTALEDPDVQVLILRIKRTQSLDITISTLLEATSNRLEATGRTCYWSASTGCDAHPQAYRNRGKDRGGAPLPHQAALVRREEDVLPAGTSLGQPPQGTASSPRSKNEPTSAPLGASIRAASTPPTKPKKCPIQETFAATKNGNMLQRRPPKRNATRIEPPKAIMFLLYQPASSR